MILLVIYSDLHLVDKKQISVDEIWLPLDALLYEQFYGYYML